MHVISRKMLLEAAKRHAELAAPLDAWYRLTKKGHWHSFEDARRMFPSADSVGKYTVFNVKGNNYRLIVEINYRSERVYVRHVMTHAEYDKEKWKT